MELVPHFVDGKVTGMWMEYKQGQNYGVRLVEPSRLTASHSAPVR
jgi:hypothetical protein